MKEELVVLKEIDFKSLEKLVSAAAESLAKMSDSLAHVAKLSMAGYDEIKARRDHSRLKSLYVGLVGYSGSQMMAAGNLSLYLNNLEGGADDIYLQKTWDGFVSQLTNLISELREIIKDWKDERSDFVLEEAYSDLRDAFIGRLGILDELQDTKRPETRDELRKTRALQEKWLGLIDSLRRAIKTLATYLKG
ncbi:MULTISPECIES: hypothetical protein [unclassified Phaeobacter]|uniref:hypothetical protein n=1 Tax=unclassified Phaeobacter TaxID=2621772 RepID=UPI003A85183B